MSDQDAKSRGILRWLGLGSAPRDDQTKDASDGAAATLEAFEADDPRERRRRQLLGDIGSFLLTHRLEVNSFTLAVANDVLTGADPKLARLLEERVISRLPVTL